MRSPRAGRVDGDHPDPLLFLPVEFDELRDDAALAYARRPREPHRERSPGLGVDLRYYPWRLFVFALYLGDHPRQRPPVTREQPFYEPGGVGPFFYAHSVWSSAELASVWYTTQYFSVLWRNLSNCSSVAAGATIS
jgi:hypothetical protein